MNNFEENTWPAELVELDGRITTAFAGLEASRSLHDATGEPLDGWVKAEAERIAALAELINTHAHAARKAHWLAELARIAGDSPPPAEEPLVAPAEEVVVEEPAAPVEELPVAVEEPPAAPAEELPRRGGKRHG